MLLHRPRADALQHGARRRRRAALLTLSVAAQPAPTGVGAGFFGQEASWTGGLPGAANFISGYLQTRIKSGPLPGRRQPYARHYYGRDSAAASPEAKRATLDSVWRYTRTRYAANHTYNLRVLEELIRFARERGFEPVLFEQPLNTEVAGDWAGVLPRYRAESSASPPSTGSRTCASTRAWLWSTRTSPTCTT